MEDGEGGQRRGLRVQGGAMGWLVRARVRRVPQGLRVMFRYSYAPTLQRGVGHP